MGDCFHPDADGVIVIEAESVPPGGWVLETDFDGYQGSGYYCDRAGSSDNELAFKFVLPTAGEWRISVRNYQDGGTHESNDAWAALDDGTDIKLFTHSAFRCEDGVLEQCDFNWNTGLDPDYPGDDGLLPENILPGDHPNDEQTDPNDHPQFVKPAGYTMQAGEHTFYIGQRSPGYCVDRIHIYPDQMLTDGLAATARDVTKPESPMGACH
jgi:hypothetical protein